MDYMNVQDAPSARLAECYVTIDGKRYAACFAKDFEANMSIETKEVPVLGKRIKGRKVTGAEIKFKMTIYKTTEIFDKLVYEYKNSGVMQTFDIQVTQDDKATSIGKSTKVYNDCVIDGDLLLSRFDTGGDFIEQSIEGYANDYTEKESYNDPTEELEKKEAVR